MSRRHLSILALFLLVAGFVRFYQITAPSMWLDEIWSIEMARGLGSQHDLLPDKVIRVDQPDLTSPVGQAPLWSIWTHLELVSHPPLFYLLLRAWMNLFGDSALGTRSLSAIAALFEIFIFFDVCRLLHGPRVGLIAAALMALAIAQIDIGQDARPYPELIFLGLCCCDAVVRIQYFGASFRRLALLTAAVTATMLTHYLAAGPLAALGVYALIRLRGRDRNKVVAAFVVGGLLMALLWGWQFRAQVRSFPSFNPGYLKEDGSHHILRTFSRVLKLPVQFFCGEDIGQKIRLPIHLGAAIILLVPILRLRARPENLLWILWVAGAIGLATLTDLTHNSRVLDYLRYTILASPGVYALIANFDLPQYSKFRDAVPCGVLAIMMVFIGLRWRDGVPAKMDFRALSRIIQTQTDPEELLVYYNHSQFASPGLWYLGCRYYFQDSRHPWITLRSAPDANLVAEFTRRKTICLIGVSPETDGPKILPGWKVQTVWQNSAGDMARMECPAAVH